MRFKYNSPIILTFALFSFSVLIADMFLSKFCTGVFALYSSQVSTSNPFTWIRLVSYVFVHAGWDHFNHNFALILLIGPIIEEKYGAGLMFLMIMVTAAATGVLWILIGSAGLVGASGICFMLILLASFTNIRSGEIPITFILVMLIYLVGQFFSALTPDRVSQLAHIAGGIMGAAFGFMFSKKRP